MSKVENKKDAIPTTIRVYREDIEKFRNYVSNTAGVTQKECFRELMEILDKTNGENKQGDLISFWTWVKNEFNPETDKEAKFFSIAGRHLTLVMANNQIICDEDNKYKRVDQQTFVKTDIVDEIEEWSSAINTEFNVNLDIEGWIKEHRSVYYNFRIDSYKDVVRDKYLIYDHMQLIKKGYKSTEQKQLIAHRFFYVKNKEEIEKRLQQGIYLLIGEEQKENICKSLEMKTILSENLEDELKKYYEL